MMTLMENIVHEGKKDELKYYVCSTRDEMGKLAANLASKHIKKLLAEKEEIRVIFASAPSQDETLHYLTNDQEMDWSRIVGFHMDEYIGLPTNSDQWFKNYLEKNILEKVVMKQFHFIDGTADPEEEMERYAQLLNEQPIDIVCLGIGENGHIAFNDPPVADFQDPKTIKRVELDQKSRQQQVNDGCFPSIQDVPTHALTLTIPALTATSAMICTVPGPTKKEAVSNVLNGEIDISCPATIMRKHHNAYLIMDSEAFGG